MNEYNNHLVLNRLSDYLNNEPDTINQEMIHSLTDLGIDSTRAFALLLGTMLELEDQEVIMNEYIYPMVKRLDIKKYMDDLYYQRIKLEQIQGKNWEIGFDHYAPYEAFVYNDLKKVGDKLIPSIGFFEEEYRFPVIYSNHREWMLITPNEIETMKNPIEHAYGEVCTYGLGLGYFAYHVSLKQEVRSVTVIEKDQEVISLFKKFILPQFENRQKIKIIHYDALEYAKKKKYYDYVFIDLWHDPSDGLELYHTLKKMERKDVKYDYWIEETLKCYE